ncbi:hypothetical protein [Lysinibacillus varians]|uniref:Phage protein n=1 Tax=Lysinibacillus varians TaxID=1145276 RepID=A0ABY2TCS8_9BACI|nr:hypothetical protein [Lysinibacillus varians]AHN24374.1 hypothetical protein T479_16405 [Lysinibacillus varians]TKI66081.1 hypothetical protein FC752_05820 [Lysinibacillus varians]
MKAILNVKGTKLSVIGLNINEDKFTSVQVLDAEGKVTTHYDSKYAPYVPEGASVINLKEALEFPDANKEIVEDLNQLLVDSRDHLKDLGEQIIQEVLVHDGLPFGDSALPNLVKEYKEHRDYIDGVESALEVVKRDNYA